MSRRRSADPRDQYRLAKNKKEDEPRREPGYSYPNFQDNAYSQPTKRERENFGNTTPHKYRPRDPRISHVSQGQPVFNVKQERKENTYSYQSYSAPKVKQEPKRSSNSWVPLDDDLPVPQPPEPQLPEVDDMPSTRRGAVYKPAVYTPPVRRQFAQHIYNKQQVQQQTQQPKPIPANDFIPIPQASTAISSQVKLESLNSDPRNLPIASHRADILQLIRQNQVVVISGDTGSGKSTQIPKFILEDCLARRKHCSIVCSQPRRIAATSLARRVSSELNTTLGDTVGYQISMDKNVSPSTKILFCTTGILVERLVHQGTKLNSFTHIILDEVHERSLEIDLTLILLKKLLPKNPKVRLILMSATFDCELFANYFPLASLPTDPYYYSTEYTRFDKENVYNLDDCSFDDNSRMAAPVKEINGFCFPTNVYYVNHIYKQLGMDHMEVQRCENDLHDQRPRIGNNIYELAVKLVTNIDRQNADNNRETESILIFLPGFGEIKRLYEMFTTMATEYDFWLIPLHSSIKHEEQGKIFQVKEGYRKVVLATNIAESSITVPDVRFVIDFGLFKESYFDPDTNLESLRLEWASRANLNQRKGRAGRVRSGYVYRLFKSELFEELPQYATPEILRAPLEKLILSIKVYGEPVSLLSLALDPPDLSGVVNAVENLRDAGALTQSGGDLQKVLDVSEEDPSGDITHLGRLYARLPLNFRVSRMLFLAHIFGFLEEGLIMAACMSIRSPFEVRMKPSLDAFTRRVEYAYGTNSDSLSSLFVFQEWKYEKRVNNWTHSQKMRWEKIKCVDGRTLSEIELLVHQLAKRLKEYGITIPDGILDDATDEGDNEEGIDLDQDANYYKGYDDSRSPERETSQRREMDEMSKRMLICVLFGSFYPNYLQTQFTDEKAWSFAVNNSDKLEYDPTRTVEIIHVPEDATERDVEDLFFQCGIIDQCILEYSRAHVEFKKTRESPNLSVLKALKLGSISRLCLGEDRDYRRYEARRNNSLRGRNYSTQSRGTPVSAPFNPFQVTYVSVASRLRTIIPRDSINSAFIDDSFVYTPRFLVACFISKTQQNSTDTRARETTFLPSIPLLAPILTMIFAPSNDVMFRVNPNYNKYLGCLVGKKLEFDFDAILTTEDLEQINELRRRMNEALTADGIKKPDSYPLRRLLLALCDRKRAPLKMRPEPGAFNAANGAKLIYSDATQSYKAEGEDEIQAQYDFVPISRNEDVDIFPPIAGVHPPLQQGYDYDSEEEFRVSMLSKIEDFEHSAFHDGDDDGNNREEPEVVCLDCKAPIAEISSLEPITNPFNGGIAWRLTDPTGFVYSSELNDEQYTKKLRKPISYIVCKENHIVGWNEEGRKIITPDSEVEIHGIYNEVVKWTPAAWNRSFEMFKHQLENRKPKRSRREELERPREFNCPCCKVVLQNKKAMFSHLNSNRHKQQKEEVLRKNKYARYIRN